VDDIIFDLSQDGIEIIDETEKRLLKAEHLFVNQQPLKNTKNKRYYDDP
jgi:hypothetical protein